MLSFPDIHGVPKNVVQSKRALFARTSCASLYGPSGFLSEKTGSDQQKLSRSAILSREPPVAILFLIASSIAQDIMWYVSKALYFGHIPWLITTPSSPFKSGLTTPALLGPLFCEPVRGLTTLPPCTSWSYWRTTYSLLQTFHRPKTFIKASP